MTYGSMIRQCLLEEAERLRLDPVLMEEIAKKVVKAAASLKGINSDKMGKSKDRFHRRN